MESKAPWETELELVEKSPGETDPSYGFDSAKRPIREHIRFGVINLDKPTGPSSHEVVAWAKRIMHLEHAGHGGTLETSMVGKIPTSPAYCPWL